MKDNGNTLKKYIPELGGNAAFVINEDADLELASNIALSAFDNAGQRCTAIKRILLHNQVADKFIEKFISKVKDIKYGDPFDENNKLAILAVRTLVFPVPAPDKTKRGPSNISTAFF